MEDGGGAGEDFTFQGLKLNLIRWKNIKTQ